MLSCFFIVMKGVRKMNKQKFFQQVLSAILVALLLGGCGTPVTSPTTEPSPEPAVELGDIIFDGTECTVSGPTELSPGKYSYVLKDLSDYEVIVHIHRLSDGKTFQDVLDQQSEPGEHFPNQDWMSPVVEPGFALQKPDGGEVHTYFFISEREYVISLWSYPTTTHPPKIWICAPFWVREASSE
jgi:hypothetical protein